VLLWPLRSLKQLPAYIERFRRWLSRLFGSVWRLTKTVTPVIALLGIGLLVAGFAGTGIPAVDNTSSDVAGAFSNTTEVEPERKADHEYAVFRAINDKRASEDLNRLEFDERLAQAAANHSLDMADRDYFAHESPEGGHHTDRMRRAGVQCTRSSEILYKSDSLAGSDGIGKITVSNWMRSAGHRGSLLGESWSRIGVGVAEEGDGYVTVIFCY